MTKREIADLAIAVAKAEHARNVARVMWTCAPEAKCDLRHTWKSEAPGAVERTRTCNRGLGGAAWWGDPDPCPECVRVWGLERKYRRACAAVRRARLALAHAVFDFTHEREEWHGDE